MDVQIEEAVEFAFNPTVDQTAKARAYIFLEQLRQDANGWQVCLNLFTRSPAPNEVVRMVCLEIVNNAVQYQHLELLSLKFIRESLMGYARQCYGEGRQDVDSAAIQNKLTQTLTYLFTSLYGSEWISFFQDFRTLACLSDPDGNPKYGAVKLYMRILGSIHDEIADVMMPRTPEEQKRSNELKDLIRARDLTNVAVTWREILARWRQMDLSIVEMCLRTIAKWVSWIDISVVIDNTIQSALLELAGQQGPLASDSKEADVRDAAIDTYTETVGKKMQPGDKIELIRYLNIADIVAGLIESPALSALRQTPHYDTDLSEAVAKLVNNVVYDLVKTVDNEPATSPTWQHANILLQSFVPFLLRFFADEYDEICSAVIPSLTDLLTMFRKRVKSQSSLAPEQAAMLRPILDAIIAKMKYDETANWGDESEATDEAVFQELRKRLYVLQQTIAAIDERLYIHTLSGVITSTFSNLETEPGKSDWRDLDLALHEMYLFGDLTVKTGGLYQKNTPATDAARCLLDMVGKMIQSGVAVHQHPAIQIQYLEICVRYVQFFEHNSHHIPAVMETFVHFVHSPHAKVRLRSWYLFQRFVKYLRGQLGNIALNVVQAIGDLLTIKAELPESKDEDDISSEDNGQSADATFTSQLYLFEAIGCVASTAAVPIETKTAIAKSVITPLCSDIERNLEVARNGDESAVLQVSQVIMALGTLANGFSDWTPGSPTGTPPPSRVSDEFVVASEATLSALETLRESSDVRTAARHTFSRTLGVLGSSMLLQLPRWIDGLLSSASSNDEMAMFLRTLAQVVYGFKSEIFDILDRLLTPLLQRVFAGLGQPSTGTDDEIQLKELRREYLSFILVILNNDLGPALVSPTNQAIFEGFVLTIARYSNDHSDPQSARQAFSILNHMSELWGGPNIDPSSSDTPSPSLPGFDAFMISQFAPLSWTLLAAPAFNPRDAQMRSVVHEAAVLQWTVLRKVGERYHSQLQNELTSLGVSHEGSLEYFRSISGDQAAFKKFFASFAQQAQNK